MIIPHVVVDECDFCLTCRDCPCSSSSKQHRDSPFGTDRRRRLGTKHYPACTDKS